MFEPSFFDRLTGRFWHWLESKGPPVTPTPPLEAWFQVSFDEEGCRIDVHPPGEAAWAQSISWGKIVRVCYKPEMPDLSDGLYLFTTLRPECFVIPVEAKGGGAFWEEILRRGLFDARLAIEAASALEGVYCWPQAGET